MSGGPKPPILPLPPKNDFNLPSPLSGDGDDVRSLPAPPPPQSPPFQPLEQRNVLTPREIEQWAGEVTAGEQLLDEKVSDGIAKIFPSFSVVEVTFPEKFEVITKLDIKRGNTKRSQIFKGRRK